LHYAASYGHLRYLNIVEELIALKVEVNATNDIGWTPLHFAACKRYLDLVRVLLNNGAKVDAQDNGDQMPFDLAKNEEIKAILQETHKKQEVKVDAKMSRKTRQKRRKGKYLIILFVLNKFQIRLNAEKQPVLQAIKLGETVVVIKIDIRLCPILSKNSMIY
jgi:ankyrin repeat protein